MARVRRDARRFGSMVVLLAFGFAVVMLVASGAGSAHGARVLVFRGHGATSLPNFSIRSGSTMSWANSGSFFQISSHGGYCNDGAVASQAHRGTSYIPPGRYSDMSVAAIGDWTITVRQGVEKLSNPLAFSGAGEKALPPFRLRNARTMYWTNTGTNFQVYSGRQDAGNVGDGYPRGKTRLPAGRYQLFVNATAPEQPDGRWRIVIR